MKCPECERELTLIEVKEFDDHTSRKYGCNGCTKQYISVETLKYGERRRIEGKKR